MVAHCQHVAGDSDNAAPIWAKLFWWTTISTVHAVFNATVIIAGLDSQSVSVSRGFHFYIIEFSFMALTYAVYRQMLKHRAQVLLVMQKFCNGNGALVITFFVIAITVFNYIITPTDRSSRIAYMTDAWFSLVKPFIQIITPLSYVLVFIMLASNRRRYLGYILLTAIVIANIATGSKASFSIGLFTAFLVLRDLAGLTIYDSTAGTDKAHAVCPRCCNLRAYSIGCSKC